MNLKIAILDHPSSELDLLTEHIHHYQKDSLVDITLNTYYSSDDFFDTFQKNSYHLIFLNTALENTPDMMIGKKLRELDPYVRLILTSDTPQYALEGYELHAYAYLLTPYTYCRILKILEDTVVDYKLKVPYITVKENRCNINIMLDDIVFIDVDNHYLQIHTTSRIIRTYMRFRDFEPIISSYKQFLCCYRNILVNMDHIEATQDMDFKMDTGDFVPIRRNAKQEMRQKFADYLFEKNISNRF